MMEDLHTAIGTRSMNEIRKTYELNGNSERDEEVKTSSVGIAILRASANRGLLPAVSILKLSEHDHSQMR